MRFRLILASLILGVMMLSSCSEENDQPPPPMVDITLTGFNDIDLQVGGFTNGRSIGNLEMKVLECYVFDETNDLVFIDIQTESFSDSMSLTLPLGEHKFSIRGTFDTEDGIRNLSLADDFILNIESDTRNIEADLQPIAFIFDMQLKEGSQIPDGFTHIDVAYNFTSSSIYYGVTGFEPWAYCEDCSAVYNAEFPSKVSLSAGRSILDGIRFDFWVGDVVDYSVDVDFSLETDVGHYYTFLVDPESILSSDSSRGFSIEVSQYEWTDVEFDID